MSGKGRGSTFFYISICWFHTFNYRLERGRFCCLYQLRVTENLITFMLYWNNVKPSHVDWAMNGYIWVMELTHSHLAWTLSPDLLVNQKHSMSILAHRGPPLRMGLWCQPRCPSLCLTSALRSRTESDDSDCELCSLSFYMWNTAFAKSKLVDSVFTTSGDPYFELLGMFINYFFFFWIFVVNIKWKERKKSR